MTSPDIVELRFSVLGNRIKSDHGYALYATIKKKILSIAPEILPQNNFPDNVSLSKINGKEYPYFIYINNYSFFKVRCPSDYGQKLKSLLNNQLLELGSNKIFLYDGEINSLSPYTELKSEIVMIKYPFWIQQDCEQRFLRSCKKQLTKLNIKKQPTIMEYKWRKNHQRIITVQKPLCLHRYIGYGVAISSLTQEESILLQINGIGGKRHMGCGWFE
jgi:CRISPR-associated protein Cas6